jgi:hypothetical protein
MRDRADPAASRFAALFEAWLGCRRAREPAVYHDDFADEVAVPSCSACRSSWSGATRSRTGAAAIGSMHCCATWRRRCARVSAHPDAILRLGTKDVLFETRDLPFGSDVHRIDSLEQLESELPQRLRQGARVLKQHRGHSGIGVWRVEQSAKADAEGAARPARQHTAAHGHGALQRTLAPVLRAGRAAT